MSIYLESQTIIMIVDK